jgi:hypothetical protein
MAKRLSELKNGEKVKFGRLYGKPITWVIADQNHKGYPDGAVTVVAADILKLAAFDAKEPENEKGNRADYGNNNYRESNIRAWLNSAKGPGKWFEKTHRQDAPPIESNVSCNPYADDSGFLAEFAEEERSAILATELFTVLPKSEGGGRNRVVDKVFLLSAAEAGFSGDDTEGYPLVLFTDDASRIAQLSPEAAENLAYKHDLIRPGETWFWWLRTPVASYSCYVRYVRYVRTGGTLSDTGAYRGTYGLRPACNLKSDLLIFDSPDADGAYKILLEEEFLFEPKEMRIITIEAEKGISEPGCGIHLEP